VSSTIFLTLVLYTSPRTMRRIDLNCTVVKGREYSRISGCAIAELARCVAVSIPGIRQPGVESGSMRVVRSGLSALTSIASRSLVWVFLVVLLPRFSFPQSLPSTLPIPQQLPAGYVGSGTCRNCHATEYQSYESSGMARSLYKPSTENDPEFRSSSKQFFHAKSGFHYEMIERSGRFYQKRFLLDPAGNPTRVREEEITYVAGSGSHARTYLRHHADGRITELPVSWYPQEKAWGMSPGYDSKNQPDFSREVNHDCIFCHSSYPRFLPSLTDLEKFFPYQLPLGIDCERCHGPGEKHAKLVAAGASRDAIRNAIFQPARASKPMQRDLCYQCHFDAGVQFARDRIVRPDRELFSYRPGEPLSGVMISLDYAPKDRRSDEFKIVSQAYRMEQSICFRTSQGQMTCTTCHDPHQRVQTAERVRWFRSRCLQCHGGESCKENRAARQRQKDDCAACHMWKRRTEDSVHTVFTDHKIQRLKPRRDLLAPLTEKSPAMTVDKALVFYGPQGLDAPEQEYFLGMAYLQLPPEQLSMSEWQRTKGIGLLEQFLRRVEQPSLATPRAEKEKRSSGIRSDGVNYVARAYLALASSYRARGRRNDALRATEQSLRYDSGSVLAGNFKCGLLTELGKPQDAFACFEQSLALNPWDARVYRNIGSLYALNGSMDDAIRLFKQSLAVEPESAGSYHYLGDAWAEKGDLREAISSYESALDLEPRDAETYWDCALALQKIGDKGLALRYVRSGLHYAPADPRGLELLSKIGGAVSRDGPIQK
jgi:tetratricopeptide (TPR) repeat protein